jgi:hypothetical protein
VTEQYKGAKRTEEDTRRALKAAGGPLEFGLELDWICIRAIWSRSPAPRRVLDRQFQRLLHKFERGAEYISLKQTTTVIDLVLQDLDVF